MNDADVDVVVDVVDVVDDIVDIIVVSIVVAVFNRDVVVLSIKKKSQSSQTFLSRSVVILLKCFHCDEHNIRKLMIMTII